MKKKLLAILLAVVLAVSLLPGAAFAAGGDFSVCVTGTEAYAYAYEVAEQVNQLRAGLGLSRLVIDPVLMETAMQRAAECSVLYSSSHSRPNGERCFTAFPNRGNTYFAENIAAGYATPSSVMNGWINSSGHYRNMTSTSVNAIGVGCFYINGTYYWAQCFTGGVYSTGSAKKADQQATVTMPATGENLSLSGGGTGAISLRVGESAKLPVYNRNQGFYSTAAQLSGVPGAALAAGKDLVKLDSDTLTVTAVSAGSGTVTLSLPSGDTLSYTVQVAERFSDVRSNAWYGAAVNWAVENNLVAGYEDGTFKPQKPCTEAEILVFLWVAAGKPDAAKAPVNAASWAQGAVNWAYEQNLIGASFRSSVPCTRLSAVTYLWKLFGSETSAPSAGFPDVPGNSSAVNWALDEHILKGFEDGTFRPNGTCERGQIATLLYYAYNPELRPEW